MATQGKIALGTLCLFSPKKQVMTKDGHAIKRQRRHKWMAEKMQIEEASGIEAPSGEVVDGTRQQRQAKRPGGRSR